MIMDCVLAEIGILEDCHWRRVAYKDVHMCMLWKTPGDASVCEFAMMERDGYDVLGLILEDEAEVVLVRCFDAMKGVSRPQYIFRSHRFELGNPECFSEMVDFIRDLVESADYVPLAV